MTAQLAPAPVFSSRDAFGLPLVGGKLYTYAAGTTTPQATYVDSTQTTQNTNPVVLNQRGEAFVWLNPLLVYKFVLFDIFGNLIWSEDNIPGGAFISSTGTLPIGVSLLPTPTNTLTLGSVSFSWANVYVGPNSAPVLDAASGNIGYYARTAAEIAANVTPTNYVYSPGPIADARRYGFSASATAAVNTTAITNAFLSLPIANGGPFPGGTVQLPSGIFNLNPVVIPYGCILKGAGKQGTQIQYPGSGAVALFTLGGTSSGLYYGCGLTDMDIRLTAPGPSTMAVLCQGTQGARVHDLYIQGPTGAAGNGQGVVIDGSNASSFQNSIRNVQCNHIGNSFIMNTTGSLQSTQSVFDNCYAAVGDVGASIGFACYHGCGNGSVWLGGDLEGQGTGIQIGTGSDSASGGVTFHGTRFEGNVIDVLIEPTPFQCVFIGCINLGTGTNNPPIVDNSAGSGYQNTQFIGCVKTGLATGPWPNLPSQFVGSVNSRASVATDVPLQAQAFSGQTADLLQLLAANGTTKQFGVNSAGQITSLAGTPVVITMVSGSPNTQITASPGAIALNVGGGSINTLWVKESGTNTNTGWVAK